MLSPGLTVAVRPEVSGLPNFCVLDVHFFDFLTVFLNLLTSRDALNAVDRNFVFARRRARVGGAEKRLQLVLALFVRFAVRLRAGRVDRDEFNGRVGERFAVVRDNAGNAFGLDRFRASRKNRQHRERDEAKREFFHRFYP